MSLSKKAKHRKINVKCTCLKCPYCERKLVFDTTYGEYNIVCENCGNTWINNFNSDSEDNYERI